MLTGKSKVVKHSLANTFYLIIPASMSTDSQFPFKDGDRVELKVINEKLEVKKTDGARKT